MFNKKVKLYLSLKTILALIVLNKFYCVKPNHEKKPGLIYILAWTDIRREPFRLWSTEQESLITNNCGFQNCYIVKDKTYFQNVTNYDAILFTPIGLADNDLPKARSVNQIYVFTCVEPAAYLLLDKKWNWFFNYTWTYRLDSDLMYPFFFITNNHGKRVGPQVNAHWKKISQMRPTPNYITNRFIGKRSAAAWFVTRCVALNKRTEYAQDLNKALQKYNLSIDIYGPCSPGNLKCPKEVSDRCLNLVEHYYYFYLAFENSNCEDYVTEKLLTALMHYAVPVVIGGSNYSIFMPDGIYLDANTLSEEEVAEAMYEAITDKQNYYDYFRWHHYYTYRPAQGGHTDPLCEFCAFLNNESIRNTHRVYSLIDRWWNEFRIQNFAEGLILSHEENPFIHTFVTNTEETIYLPTALKNIFNVFTNLFNFSFS